MRGSRTGSSTRPAPAARCTASGAPTTRAAPTSRPAARTDGARWRSPPARARIPGWHSLRRSCCTSLRAAHDSHEKIGDARRAYFTERGELAAIDVVEQEHAATEHLPLVQRL